MFKNNVEINRIISRKLVQQNQFRFRSSIFSQPVCRVLGLVEFVIRTWRRLDEVLWVVMSDRSFKMYKLILTVEAALVVNQDTFLSTKVQ